jgi:hypothetical protein
MLTVGIILGVILLLAFLSKDNSPQASNRNHFARPSSRDNSVSPELWSSMQATNDLSNTNSDYSGSDSSSVNSGSSDCGNSWSGDTGNSWGGDCGGGGSWGGSG